MAHVSTNIDKSRSPIAIPYLILLLVAVVGGAATLFALVNHGNEGANGTGDAVPVVQNLGATSFTPKGPFGVGQTTLTLPSNGARVVVWYPANPNDYHGQSASYNVAALLPPALQKLEAGTAPVIYPTGAISNIGFASGRFPLVVFSHSFAGFATQSTFLTSHLASWGFVVAAPEHTDRDLTAVLNNFLAGKGLGGGTSNDVTDLQNTIALMANQNAIHGNRFYQHLDMNRVGAVGHSAGGSAVEKLAVVDPQVKVFVGLAGASVGAFGQTTTGAGASVPKVPGLIESGTADQVVPTKTMVAAYNKLNQPKRFITLTNAGHLVFSDICQIDPGQGGLIGLAEKINLPIPAQLKPLGSDGCQSTDLAVTTAWPAITQSVTAELRWALGFDTSQAGLQGLSQVFPGVVGVNTTANTVAVPN